MEITQTTAATPETPAPARLWNRNFFLLWQGQAVSQLGNQAFSLSMMYWVMQKTGSASLVGLLLTLSTLPGVLLAPFGGTFADRNDRVRIIVVCDVLAGLSVLGLGLTLMVTDGTHIGIPLLFSVAVLIGIIKSFFSPAVNSAIPDLVPKERLAAANSFNQFSIQIASSLGQAVGGVLYQALGAWKLFFFDGLTYLFSGGCASFINAPAPPPRDKVARSWRERLRDFSGETWKGLLYVWERKGLRDFMAVAASINFFAMPGYVLFPFYVEKYLDVQAGAAWTGYLLSAYSVGMVAGFTLASTLKLKGEVRGWTLLLALLIGPMFVGCMGFVSNPYLALAIMLMGGVVFGIIHIYIITLLQVSTPSEMRGRVLGLLGTLGGALMPIGMALSGWLGDVTDKNVRLIFAASAVLSVLFTLVLATRRDCRAFLKQS